MAKDVRLLMPYNKTKIKVRSSHYAFEILDFYDCGMKIIQYDEMLNQPALCYIL